MNSFESELQALTSTELYDKGMDYLYGNGVEQNIDEAIFLLQKSAESVRMFQRSSELGNKDAMFELAALLVNRNKDETKAVEWLIKYNDGNELASWACLADLYYSKNPKKAFAIYKEVVKQGGNRYYTLGEMYSKGKGTERNVHEAIKWFTKASEIENINDSSDEYCKWDSMLKIAEIYVGLKDETKALEWLTKRNDGNRFQGMGELAHIYYGDDDFEYEDTSLIDKEKAFEWFGKLYKLKDSHGAYYFAEMWESKSRSKALQIYKDGVEFGSERCCKRIIQLYLEIGNIPEAASWTIKYFEMVDEELCANLFRNPFIELKQIANFFIETPTKGLVQLYGGDKEFAADAIYNFERACDKTLVNLYTKLELMSIVADLQGDNCPRELLETLVESYEKFYREVRDNGMSEEIEGDEEELRLKKMFNKKEKVVKGNYHDAEYYREKFLYFKSKLMIIGV